MAEKKSFLLRLKLEIWRELERWAADEFRSVNGQIEFILHEAIRRERNKKLVTADLTSASGRPKEGT